MVPPQNPNDFDFTFWSRSRLPDKTIPAYIRETREHQNNALRHELSKALAIKPLSCRDSDGTYRGTKGEPLDPAALYHIGVPLPPPVTVEPGEPDWSLHVDPRRPLIGDLHRLFADDWGSFRYYLQIFRYTAAGRIPDGLPQCIYDGRIQGGHSIYACDHLPPPPFTGTPRFYRLNEGNQDSQLRNNNLHPDQYAHLDPALVAQVLPHPHERFLPENRIYPEPAPDDAPAADNNTSPRQPVSHNAASADRNPNTPEKSINPALNILTLSEPPTSSHSDAKPDTDTPEHQPHQGETERALGEMTNGNVTRRHNSNTASQTPHRDRSTGGRDTAASNTAKVTRSESDPGQPSLGKNFSTPHHPNNVAPGPRNTSTVPSTPEKSTKPVLNALTSATEKPPKPFSEDQKRMLHLLEIGFTIAEATKRMACSRSCFNNWTARNPAFKQAAIDARDRYCEDIASDMDQLHNTVRERLELWIHAKETPENLRFRAVSLFLRYAHTPHLLPRRLQALMPHSLHADANAMANTNDNPPEPGRPHRSDETNGEPSPTQAKPDQSTTTIDQKAPSPTPEPSHTQIPDATVPDATVPVSAGADALAPDASTAGAPEPARPQIANNDTQVPLHSPTETTDTLPVQDDLASTCEEQQSQRLPCTAPDHSASQPSPITDNLYTIDLPSINAQTKTSERPNQMSHNFAEQPPRTQTPSKPRTFPYSSPLPQPPDGRIFQP